MHDPYKLMLDIIYAKSENEKDELTQALCSLFRSMAEKKAIEYRRLQDRSQGEEK